MKKCIIFNLIIYGLIVNVLIFGFSGRVLAENGDETLKQSQQEVSGVWEKIKNFSEKFASAVFGFFKKIWQGIGNIWKEYLEPFLSDFWTGLKKEFQKELEEMKHELSNIGKNFWNKILEKLKFKKD